MAESLERKLATSGRSPTNLPLISPLPTTPGFFSERTTVSRGSSASAATSVVNTKDQLLSRIESVTLDIESTNREQDSLLFEKRRLISIMNDADRVMKEQVKVSMELQMKIDEVSSELEESERYLMVLYLLASDALLIFLNRLLQ